MIERCANPFPPPAGLWCGELSKLIDFSCYGWAIEDPANLAALRNGPPSIATDRLENVAVVRMDRAALVDQHNALSRLLGWAEYGELTAAIDAAVADPGIAGILVEMDIVAGTVGGLMQASTAIAAAALLKPLIVFSPHELSGPGLLLASCANKVYVGATFWRGGAVQVHDILRPGRLRLDGGLVEQLIRQRRPDPRSAKAIRALCARRIDAHEARRVGLVDEIGSREDALAALHREIARGGCP